MTRRSIKSWQVISASLLLLAASYGIVRACSGGDWDESYTSNYSPEAFVADSTQAPFFYTWLFYYKIGFDTQHNERFNDANIAEWSGYLKGSLDSASLGRLLYTMFDANIDVLADYYQGKRSSLPDSVSRQLKRVDKRSKQQSELIAYLQLAKKCEAYATNHGYYWEEEPALPEAEALGNLQVRLSESYGSTSSSFLKERYWFQLIRYYYFYDKEKCVSFFEESKSHFSPGNMYYRSMAYAAGALLAQGKVGMANYYYSLVYESCGRLKIVAHASFRPKNESDWLQTLALCRNDNERITLWQMLGVGYSDEIRSMKEIYKLSPRSDKMDLLLTRFVNQQETGTTYSAENPAPDSLVNDITWCRQVADKGKVSNPFLWNVSVGYLLFLSGDYKLSADYYRKAEAVLPKSDLAVSQLRLLKLLTQIRLLGKITPADEKGLLSDMKWLFSLPLANTGDRLRYYNAQEWVKQEMAKKYLAQGDIVRSECFVTGNSFYKEEQNIEKLKSFLSGITVKSVGFDILCAEMSAKKLKDLWEYQAIKAAYSDSLSKALKLMQHVSASNTLPGNPFLARINDCHDCDHASPQKVSYTKHIFLKRLKEIEDAVAKGQNIEINAFMVGNAFYNMSHYGNARAFYEGRVIGEYHYSPFAIPDEFSSMLTSNRIAKKYYMLAFQHAKSNEQKAKYLFMMAKCERNEWYNHTFYNNKENEYRYNQDQIDFVEWNSFRLLKSYRNTKFYKEAIKECGYFRKAVRG